MKKIQWVMMLILFFKNGECIIKFKERIGCELGGGIIFWESGEFRASFPDVPPTLLSIYFCSLANISLPIYNFQSKYYLKSGIEYFYTRMKDDDLGPTLERRESYMNIPRLTKWEFHSISFSLIYLKSPHNKITKIHAGGSLWYILSRQKIECAAPRHAIYNYKIYHTAAGISISWTRQLGKEYKIFNKKSINFLKFRVDYAWIIYHNFLKRKNFNYPFKKFYFWELMIGMNFNEI